MAPERRACRQRGKLDPIDALAVARAALREPPRLNRPRSDEQPFRELKLLVDHRDDLVDERRRAQQRLRWHHHQLDPALRPREALDRPVHLDRVGRWLARPAEVQARVARELVVRCRPVTRTILELDRELERRTAEAAPRCSSCPAAARSPPPSCSPRSARSTASRPTPSSPATAASHHSKRAQAACSGTGSTAAATASSTARSTGSRSRKLATTPPRAPPGAQTSRRQEPPRGNPLPQTPTRPRRLQHPQSEPSLDTGATLAHAWLVPNARDSA
jgi:transposase